MRSNLSLKGWNASLTHSWQRPMMSAPKDPDDRDDSIENNEVRSTRPCLKTRQIIIIIWLETEITKTNTAKYVLLRDQRTSFFCKTAWRNYPFFSPSMCEDHNNKRKSITILNKSLVSQSSQISEEVTQSKEFLNTYQMPTLPSFVVNVLLSWIWPSVSVEWSKVKYALRLYKVLDL